MLKVIKSIPSENIFFKEESVAKGNFPEGTEGAIVNLYNDVKYQEVLGFGGAFTESAAYNYSLMDEETKKEVIKLYFDKKEGIGYNFGRTHINSCDFSLDTYSYVADGDKTLESFDISRDKKYIIPFLKDALAHSEEEIVLFASPWSPPGYMKDTGSAIKVAGKHSHLLDEYKEAWAHYYAKYVKAFAAEGIKISAISIQNEPIAGCAWETCYYSPEDERELIEKYLIKALDEEGLSDLKIIIWDHNKERVYDRAKKVLESDAVRERVWAVGHHWYTGDHFDGLRLVHEVLDKPLISTEFCGTIDCDRIEMAERYAKEITGDFNNFGIGVCDWNLILSQNGGPYHNRNEKTVSIPGVVHDDVEGGCLAPILYDNEKKELIVTPVYYYMGHFSKFVKRGAKRLAVSKYDERLFVTAFENPDGERVMIITNTADIELPAVIRNNDVCTNIRMAPHSIMTVIM